MQSHNADPLLPGWQAAPPLRRLREAIGHAAHLLPAQGPINVFIHHNTLHAFENLTFDEAVLRGATTFGREPYLSEARYRTELEHGRIHLDDLQAVLRKDLGERANDSLSGLVSRLDLRLTMLRHPVWAGPNTELLWLLNEADVLSRFRSGVSAFAQGRLVTATRQWVMRDLRVRRAAFPWAAELLGRFGAAGIEGWSDATWEVFTLHLLWHVCCENTERLPQPAVNTSPPVRHRDLLLAVTSADADALVHDLLIRFCAVFLDQGIAQSVLPNREQGFYRSFLTLYRPRGGPPDAWLRRLPAEAARLQDSGIGPLEAIAESLGLLGVDADEQEEFLRGTLLALGGWVGMLLQVERRGDTVAHSVGGDSLVEFLAVRLLLDRLALGQLSEDELGTAYPLASLREKLRGGWQETARPTVQQRAFPVFKLAQVMGWSPEKLHRLKPDEWGLLLGEVEAFGEVQRRRVFHLAYERRFRERALEALALHRRQATRPTERPRFQVFTCLDEREESFRRHLEEVAPDSATFGTVGFFGVAMYYRGVADARFVPLCPIVLRPDHWVEERVREGHEHFHQKRIWLRRLIGWISHQLHAASRSLALGAALSAGFGAMAAVPLVARTLFPRLASRLGRLTNRTPPATHLELEHPDPTGGHEGYTTEEMVELTERLLREVGLTAGFARLVLVLGHGSDSQNNPHKSAYDCGACGGSSGAANGRAFAQMLNDPQVRSGLAARGLPISGDVWFVGGFHDTCGDAVTLFDLDRVPPTHADDLAHVRSDLDRACERNAHERCRRFLSARLDLSPSEALRHVEGRQEDLAQPRPELGHATNALCVVARRERTRGLFLDRRAFLSSYDPEQDDAEGSVLGRILAAAVPVCAGINLEYYFSHVDNSGYGSGSKLPHNVTSLLGVMDGAASDLRTGLPWQMVEIHEPVRLLFVVEAAPEKLLGVMDRNPAVGQLIRNGWVQLASLDPNGDSIQVYRSGAFRPHKPGADHLPRAESSLDWYRGWRGHLEFAEIGPTPEPADA